MTNMNKTRHFDMVVNPAFTKLVAEVQAKLITAFGRSVGKTEAIELAVASFHAHLHSPYPYTLEGDKDYSQRIYHNMGLLRGAELDWKLEDILPKLEEVKK